MDSRTFFSFALTPVAVAILSMPAMAADTLPATPDAVAAAPAVTQGAVPDVLLAQVAPVPESMPAGSVPAAGTGSDSSPCMSAATQAMPVGVQTASRSLCPAMRT